MPQHNVNYRSSDYIVQSVGNPSLTAEMKQKDMKKMPDWIQLGGGECVQQTSGGISMQFPASLFTLELETERSFSTTAEADKGAGHLEMLLGDPTPLFNLAAGQMTAPSLAQRSRQLHSEPAITIASSPALLFTHSAFLLCHKKDLPPNCYHIGGGYWSPIW